MLPTPTLRTVLSVMRRLATGKASLPVLNTVRVQRTADFTALTATNLDVALTFTEHHDQPEPNTLRFFMEKARRRNQPDLDLCIPFADLAELAGKIDPRAILAIRKEDDAWMLCGHGRDGTDWTRPVDTHESAEFPMPMIDPLKPARQTSIPAMARRLGQVIRMTSIDSTRYVLNGVHCSDSGELVATDGRRLGLSNRPPGWSVESGLTAGQSGCEPEVPTFILPQVAAEIVHHAFPPDATPLVTMLSASKVSITHGPWQIVAKLIEGDYPNFRAVIPGEENYPHCLSLGQGEVTALAEMLARGKKNVRAALCHTAVDGRSHWSVDLRMEGRVLCQRILQGHEDPDKVRAARALAHLTKASPLKITFDPNLLAPCLAGPGPATLLLEAQHPILVKRPGFTGVVMPMRDV